MKATSTGASRILLFSAAAVFLIASSMIYSFAAGGTPGLPHNFYGTLTIDGSPAPSGTQIKGMVEGVDSTFNGPYETSVSGQYGSTGEGKFGVTCAYGETIVFSVETSQGFYDANQTVMCDPAAETNLDLTVTTGQVPTCGDLSCNGDETCSTCPEDCGTCPPVCGDQSCNGDETCSTCPQDCGACPPVCGDAQCNGDETCSACPGDCGTCPPTCGDQSCNDDETCSNCPADCGPCPAVCGNDIVETGETCELPSTSDNPFCGQSASQCLGTKLGVRDIFGYCNIVCGCTEDSFTYSCVQGECGAQCSFNSDCDDGNASTVDSCLGDCTCQHTPETEYCLLITSMRVLNSAQDEDSTIPAGTMYYIEVSTFNTCDQDVQSMQIVQVLKGSMPVNLGSVDSTIHAAETSVVTVGFIMPPGTVPGTAFTAKGFNWNHWIDQSPETFEILSDTSQVGFESQ